MRVDVILPELVYIVGESYRKDPCDKCGSTPKAHIMGKGPLFYYILCARPSSAEVQVDYDRPHDDPIVTYRATDPVEGKCLPFNPGEVMPTLTAAVSTLKARAWKNEEELTSYRYYPQHAPYEVRFVGERPCEDLDGSRKENA